MWLEMQRSRRQSSWRAVSPWAGFGAQRPAWVDAAAFLAPQTGKKAPSGLKKLSGAGAESAQRVGGYWIFVKGGLNHLTGLN